jgi:prepilin-type N-terminal cleavage/methylation domain-containing protein
MQALRVYRRGGRAAYTLVELIVVVSVILVLAAVGASVGLLARGKKTQRGTDVMQRALSIAKQRALREQVPTGVRLIPQGTTSPDDHRVSELVYVQQPDDWFGPNDTVTVDQQPFGSTMVPVATFNTATGSAPTDFYGGFGRVLTAAEQYPVQPRDYLELNGGLLVQIVDLYNPNNANTCNRLILSHDPRANNTNPMTTRNHRIIRQPRRLAGENSVKLPQDVVIEVPPPAGLPPPYTSQNLPKRTVTVNTVPTTFYEIVFSPSGGVVGKGTTSNDIIMLWVSDTSRDNPLEGEPLLVTVQIRTGMVGTSPVGPPLNPFQFARDASSSGL